MLGNPSLFRLRLQAKLRCSDYDCAWLPDPGLLIRDWSRQMDGIAATIWASATTTHPAEGRTSVTLIR
jgi:hypothetical protein